MTDTESTDPRDPTEPTGATGPADLTAHSELKDASTAQPSTAHPSTAQPNAAQPNAAQPGRKLHLPSTRREHTREETDRKIALATMQIAVSEGVKAVTIEEVSRRSGVAKTTIYRRYRNSEELLENLSFFKTLPAPDLTVLKPSKENLALLIKSAVAYFDQSVGVRSVGMILCSDSDFFRQVFDHVVVPIRDRATEFFDNGKRAGVFRQNANVNFILDQVIGGMVANAAVHGSVEESWNRQIVDFLWTSIAVK